MESAVIQARKYIKKRRLEEFIKFCVENKNLLLGNLAGRILLEISVVLSKGMVNRNKVLHMKQEVLSSEDPFILSDYGLLLIFYGEWEEAENVLKKAVKFQEADESAWARLAAVYYSQNKLEKAQLAWQRSAEIAPNRPEIFYNLGVLFLNKGDLEKAVDYFNIALNIEPKFRQAEEKRNLALVCLNKIDELIEDYYSKLEKEKTPEIYLSLANYLFVAGRYSEAQAVLMEGVENFKAEAALKFRLIEVLKEVGNLYLAGNLAKRWLENDDWLKEIEDQEEVLTLLRFVLNELRIEAGFINAAEKDLESIENRENYPIYYILKSKILMEKNRGIEAAEVLRKAKERFPAHLGILSQLVHVLTSIGELEEAKEVQNQIVAVNPSAVVQQVEMENYKATDEQVELLENLLNSVAFPKATRASAGFVLHKVLEKRKEYDRAFEILIKANNLVKEELTYDWKEHRFMIQRTIEVFTPELVERLKGKGHPSKRPIFVLGMPRSGTTLTEQILGSHSQVYPAGELSFIPRIVSLIPKVLKHEGKQPKQWPDAILDFDEKLLKSAAQYYLDKISVLDSRHQRVVDKLPHNFDYVGLILLMFPNAKVIHLVRDDLDVAVSNYQQNFAAKHGTMGFAFDLKWIGHMLNDHRAIMEHWHKLFPGQIYDLDYRRLTEEPERVIKELLDFCDLPWEDKVLEFYKTKRPVKTASIKQVRQGIYRSSVEKWRRYEKFLQPVIEILNEGFKRLDEYEVQKYEDVIKPTGIIGYTVPV